MSFSFNPGQQQATPSQGVTSTPAVNSDGVPVLQVPVVPTITTGPVEEKISPFAFRNRNKSNFSVYFQFVVFFIFAVMFLTTLGLFAYQRILLSQINTLKEEIDAKQAKFPQLELTKMVRLSDRLKIINTVMNERASVRTAFRILEETVEDPVTYTRFSLSKNRSKKGYNLSFAGETTSYYSLYQQIEALNSKIFSNAFSGLVISGTGPLSKTGVGTFRADATIKIEGVDPDKDENFLFVSKVANQSGSNSTTTNTQATTTSADGQVVPVPTLIQTTP
jgi:hypothetical protein